MTSLNITCERAERVYGKVVRIVNAMEEHCEFAQVCSKYVRFISGDKFVGSIDEIRDKIIDELADCIITEMEITRYLDIKDDEIVRRLLEKQNRFEDRMDEMEKVK